MSMEDSKDIAELYKMLSESEEELQKAKDKAFEEADIEGKLRFLKSEIDNMNIEKRFDISQQMQMLAMNEALKGSSIFPFPMPVIFGGRCFL